MTKEKLSISLPYPLSLLLEIIEEAKVNAENMPTSEEAVSRKKAIEDLQKTLLDQ